MESRNRHDVENLVESLKACALKKDIHKGATLYCHILKRGLEKNAYLVSSLINMYAKCGKLTEAQTVFDKFPTENVICWNSLIAGYIHKGKEKKAFRCYEKMQRNGISPDGVTFICILKACGNIGVIDMGEKLHEEIVNRGLLKNNVVLGNALIDMYCKCGMLTKARELFDELHVRNVVTWNTLIAGYSQHNLGHEALNCFIEMQKKGLSPDVVTFTCILKACSIIGDINTGSGIHEKIVNTGLLDHNVLLGTALVDMYAKCGRITKAQEVLENLPFRDKVSWSSLIGGYVQQGNGHEALSCFERMHSEGIPPDEVTYVCILKACSTIGAIERGRQIHDEIVNIGMLGKSIVLLNTLLDMYTKCGLFAKAEEVLGEVQVRDIVSWNVLIAGYAQHEKGYEALKSFLGMLRDGLYPDGVTFACILKVCGSIGAIEKGKQIHVQILSCHMLDKNVVLGSALVDMYAKCGLLANARKVLDELSDRDTVTWSALIAGYAQDGQGHEALNCFEHMQQEGLFPSDAIFISLLKACGNIRSIEKGALIHDEIVNRGLLEKNIVLANALVDMYAKCGMPSKAELVLKDLPVRSVESWNAVIAGYAQEERGHEALNCFEKMEMDGFSPNEVTFTCALKACGTIGAIDKGKEIHDKISCSHLLDNNILLGTALVDMYAKCGLLERADQVLNGLSVRNVASWNALISGYAQEACFHEALRCFTRMQKDGIHPNEITFLCLLNACSHSGKLDEAQTYYENMNRKFGITPKLEHHTCMVAVFGSAGCFEKAISVIKTMPSFDDPSVWVALMGACWKWGNVKLGKLAFDQVIQVHDDLAAAAYVIMAGIYAEAGMTEDAQKVETMSKKFVV